MSITHKAKAGALLTGTEYEAADAHEGTLAHADLDSVGADDHHATDHDHDGAPTQQLAQANTHQSPDTDTATSALHHTLGSGANQAAAGNHTHAGGAAFTPADTEPGSPDAADDEFNTTDASDPLTGWTTMGTPTVHNIDSTVVGHYYVRKAATASIAWTGIYKARSPAFTVTCKLTDARVNVNWNSACLFIGEATPGKIEYIGARSLAIRVDSFTTPTGSGASVATGPALSPGAMPLYLRIVVTSSTSVAYYYSMGGGLIWTPVLTARNPGFTVGSVGLIVEPENGTHDAEAAFDWIRFT